MCLLEHLLVLDLHLVLDFIKFLLVSALLLHQIDLLLFEVDTCAYTGVANGAATTPIPVEHEFTCEQTATDFQRRCVDQILALLLVILVAAAD